MSDIKNKLTALSVASVMAFTGYASTVSADAFEGLSMMRMGAWEVDFSGNVNAFIIGANCEPKLGGVIVAGGLACGSNGDKYDYVDVRTGLLPAWFNFAASTDTPGGWKTGVHLSFQPGADDNSSLGGGTLGGPLGLNSSNFRQIFTTLSHNDYGTFKIGRDLGVFGSNAILEDMTLLGVGATFRDAGAGGNTTLGRIGFGYIYADWKSQLQYTTPNFSGFSATFALTDPWGAGSLANNYDADNNPDGHTYSTTNANRAQEEDTYGFEGKINYAFDAGNDVSGHVWASFITQEVDWKDPVDGCDITRSGFSVQGAGAANHANMCATGDTAADIVYTPERNDDSTAFDLGGKVVYQDFDFVAYYYDGEGLGTTDFLLDGYDVAGEQRDSAGYYVQARWRTPMGTLLGISYGESELEETDIDTVRLANDQRYSLVETNDLFVLGAYHPVGEGMNLVLEFSRSNSESHNSTESEEDALAIGAIMFF